MATDELPKNNSASKAPLLAQIKQANLEKVALFIGAQTDPDGLACQAAMTTILEKWGHKSVSFYRGAINRVQNRVMKQVLGLNSFPEKEFKEEEFTCVISLDGPASVCPVVPDFIIDHHEQNGSPKIGSDVRQTGACSTILLEYLIEAGIEFKDELGAKLATALALGIKTDTRDGASEGTTDADFEALNFCLKHKDNKTYKAILNYPRPAYHYDFHVIGWNNKKIEGSVLVTGLGTVPEQRSGVISDCAEQFCAIDGISTAVVFGVVDGNNIDISVRSSNTSLDVNEFVKNFGEGGGRLGAGKCRIELPRMFQNLPENLNLKMCDIINEIVKYKCLQIADDRK